MKVLQFTDTLRSGGKERQIVELLKGLKDFEDIEVILLSLSSEIHYPELDKLLIKKYVFERKTKKDLRTFLQFYQLCCKEEPDIIHSWNSMCSVYAVPVAKLLGIKFVNGFIRNASPSLSFRDKDWFRARLTFPFSDAIVANSHAGLEAYNAPPQKSVCLHNGFDLNRVKGLVNLQEARLRLGITTPYVVGMVASFDKKKDYPTYLRAAQSILCDRKDVTFLLIGDGPELKHCKSLVEACHSKSIKFLGLRDDVEDIVNSFSIGVLVSNASIHGEGIANAILEYMAVGKPVISTANCGGNQELLPSEKFGFLIKQEDDSELADKIKKLLDDQNLRTRMGDACRERIEKHFSIEKMTQGFVDLYQRVGGEA